MCPGKNVSRKNVSRKKCVQEKCVQEKCVQEKCVQEKCVQRKMCPKKNVSKEKCVQRKMCPGKNVSKEKCVQEKRCPKKNVSRKKFYFLFFLYLRAWRPARCYWGIFTLRARGGEAPELFSFIFRGCKIYGHSISIHEIFLSFFQNARAIYAATKHIKSMPSISFLPSIIS